MKNSFRRGLFHPDDIKTIGLGQAPAGPVSAPLVHKRSRPSLSTLIPPSSAGSGPPSARSSHSRSSSFVGSGSGSFGRADARRVQSPSEFDKYAEDDDDDNYEDVFGKATGPCKCLLAAFFEIVVTPSYSGRSTDANSSTDNSSLEQVMG